MNRCSSLIQLGCTHLSPYIVLLILGGGGVQPVSIRAV
jgi:hypothetical protein